MTNFVQHRNQIQNFISPEMNSIDESSIIPPKEENKADDCDEVINFKKMHRALDREKDALQEEMELRALVDMLETRFIRQ